MKLVAFNHHNNNTDLMHCFKNAAGDNAAPEIAGARVSTAGICFFNLHKRWREDEKLQFTVALQQRLVEQFGSGLNGVVFPSSDSTAGLFKPYFNAVSEIDPSLVKIQIGGQACERTDVVHITTHRSGEIIRDVQSAVGVTPEDIRQATEADWKNAQACYAQIYDALRKDMNL